PLPEYVIWLQSPLAGACAAAIIDRTHKNIYSNIWMELHQRATYQLWAEIEKRSSVELWKAIESELKSNVPPIERNLTHPIRTQIALQMETRFGPAWGPNYNQQMFSEEFWSGMTEYMKQQLSEVDLLTLEEMLSRNRFAWQAAGKISWYSGLGSHDAESLIFLDYANSSGFDLKDIRGLVALSRNCGWWWTFEDVCIITERPMNLFLDAEGRLHNDFGPSLEYADGWSIFSRHGSFVPERVIEFSSRKNLREIEREQNTEVRRHLIELYGLEQFLKDSEAVIIDEDECGSLYRRDLIADEPIVVVKVKNSTAEPDGTFRWYFLRVPPEISTAREAVAWTFGLNVNDYAPEVET
ncbi:MAG: hypothetical protein K2Z81_07010, partial [Cyanobacteria bacterium]|nr:hypothetical protein [Cyanobacteriota bacterium]